MDFWLTVEKMQLPQAHLYPCFLAWAFAANCMNSSGVSIHGHCFYVNGHQIKQPRWTETWNQYPERGSHPHPTKWSEWPWRSRGIWKHPIPITFSVSSEETQLPWDLVLPGNTGGLHWRWRSITTSNTHMTGTNYRRYGVRWQGRPNQSHSDWPRPCCPVLWAMVIRRGTELGQGMRHHVYTVRHPQLG